MIQPGSRLAHYEVVSALGEGGMGEVYRARDARLGREVAIKVLPREFAQDSERLARLEREARMLAALNHPNIAAIHGLGESDGTRFLVLELVEGDTLADRLARGTIPAEESLRLVTGCESRGMRGQSPSARADPGQQARGEPTEGPVGHPRFGGRSRDRRNGCGGAWGSRPRRRGDRPSVLAPAPGCD